MQKKFRIRIIRFLASLWSLSFLPVLQTNPAGVIVSGESADFALPFVIRAARIRGLRAREAATCWLLEAARER